MKKDIYETVTQTIIEQLESVNPSDWEKPWFNIGLCPYNAISGKDYRGINHVMLGLSGYQSKAYATFKQWKDKDCSVKKGEKGHSVVFWKFSEYEDADTGENKTSVFLRHYTVFNSEQVKGDFAREIESKPLKALNDHDPLETAETLIRNYLGNERLKVEKSDRAYYSHSKIGDKEHIGMPSIGQFQTPNHYYSVFLHEMTHSTGAEKRLGRDMSGGFGSKSYAKEELVAELGSAMLCGVLGIDQKPREDHAQYIASWLQALRNDKRLVISAASQAQKAADFIQESAANYQQWLDGQTLMAAE